VVEAGKHRGPHNSIADRQLMSMFAYRNRRLIRFR